MGKLLSDSELKTLEEELRDKNRFKRNMIAILCDKEVKEEDANDWIRAVSGRNEKALSNMIFKEENEQYQFNLIKHKAIQRTYDALNQELKEIMDKYFWGQYSYYDWPLIAKAEHVSTKTIYRKREKILIEYAYQTGRLI